VGSELASRSADPCTVTARFTPVELRARLDRVARTPLVAGTTPLQELPALSRETGVRILVKRDDLTGLAFGGNKVRQAEFFVGAALAEGADTMLAGGSYAQSNHARVSAAAARAAGLRAVILVRPGEGVPCDRDTGNALVTSVIADEVIVVDELANVPRGDRLGEVEARRAAFARVAEEQVAAGRRPYVLVGSSTGLGVLGYVAGSLELHEQLAEAGAEDATVFVTSLGVTHAGLELTARLLGAPRRTVGIGYQPAPAETAAAWVRQLAHEGAELLGVPVPDDLDVVSDTRQAGPDYGVPTAETLDTIRHVANSESLLLDPIYSAKGFTGLLDWIREGRVARGSTVVFVHTGGLPALFAYHEALRERDLAYGGR
jgi:1-aminocyclopropane-1-carboxylate deaminase/D-cysteine desulfhydrase-like pyridoxal-dependent ACC family enzyme